MTYGHEMAGIGGYKYIHDCAGATAGRKEITMSMNGIDISNHQAGLNLDAVPCDFVICKATEGTGFVDKYCDGWVQKAISMGKPFGVYHFATGGSSGRQEAEFFYNNIKGYVGKGILILDWEANAVSKGPGYAKEFLDRLKELTGIKGMIYMSNSVVNGYDWSSVVAGDYGLWNAGYYAGYQTMGYNPDAPLIGGTGAWSGAAMYQYTSSGRLSGWNGNLDLNVFYGDKNAWQKYANPDSASGWIKDNVGWWYRNADGSYPKFCWKKLDAWYWFDENGYAVTGWKLINGKWYYFNTDCRMCTGWVKVDGIWYYLSENGDMVDGWRYIGNYWYYLNPRSGEDVPHGGMLTGMIDVEDHTYYCRQKADGHPEGSMVIGWLKLENNWYYCNKDNDCQPIGSIFTNHWITDNGKRYYLKDDGKMACDEMLVISGKEYSFDNSGAVIV